MKRKFKQKHQDSSSEDRGGDRGKKQEEMVKDREESADINPKTENVFPGKYVTSEERESDVQDQGTPSLLCGWPLKLTMEQPVGEQEAKDIPLMLQCLPSLRMSGLSPSTLTRSKFCGSSVNSEELHRGQEMSSPIFQNKLNIPPPCPHPLSSLTCYIGNQRAASSPGLFQSHLPMDLSHRNEDAVKQFSSPNFSRYSGVIQDRAALFEPLSSYGRLAHSEPGTLMGNTELHRDDNKNLLSFPIFQNPFFLSPSSRPHGFKEPGSKLDQTSPFIPVGQHSSTNLPIIYQSSIPINPIPTSHLGTYHYGGIQTAPLAPALTYLKIPSYFSPTLASRHMSPNYTDHAFSYNSPPVSQNEVTKASVSHFPEDHDEQKPFLQHTQIGCLLPSSSPSITSVHAPPLPRSSEEEILKTPAVGSSLVQSENEPGVQLQGETEPLVMAEHFLATNTLTSSSHVQFPNTDSSETRETSRPLPRSHSAPSLSPATCAETKSLTGSKSLPELKLKSSFEEFTPDISVDEDDETYRFQCSCPGLYQCTVTGLVFHMEGEGDVVYRTVPWNRRLLSKHHKKPAGPLFDIKCLQQCVCQLHLPHCEILSTGGSQFLSVAHVSDEGIEFIRPQKITKTHVVINITGFSGYGNVKGEDSPPDPVRALVLLFYRPPDDPDPESFLSVLLVPRNIVLRELQRTRRKLVGDERYIEPSPHCKLQPNQLYTLSTCPQNCSVKVEPPEAEFDEESHSSYFTTFQVILKTMMTKLKLSLKHKSSSHTVWKRRVYLLSTTERNSCGQRALTLPPKQNPRNIQSLTGKRKSCGLRTVNGPPSERLLDVRSSFIDGISGPVLKSLLDKLLEKTVITDSERESVDEMENKRDKARFIIDTVRKKGEAASSEMIEFLCEVDPFLCGHLGLM